MSRLPEIGGGGRRRMIAAVTACALGQAAASGTAAFATRDVFAALSGGGATVPVLALTALTASGVMIAVLRIAEGVTAERLGQSYAGDTRQRLFSHISRLPRAVVRAQRRGGLSLRFVGDLGALRGWISKGLTRLITATIVLPISAAVIFALDWRLGLAVMLPMVLGMGLMWVVGQRSGALHSRLRSCRSRLSADLSERVPIAPDLRMLGRVGREKARLSYQSAQLLDAAIARALGASTLRAVPDAVSGIAGAAILLTAVASNLPAATAAGALAATALMIRPMRDLANVWDRHRDWLVAREKCNRLLDRKRLPRGRTRRVKSGDTVGLRFDRVSHGALRGCSADIPAGGKIAILGRNGAGKSTLMNLAAGVDIPERGRVTLNGQRVTSLNRRAQRIALIWDEAPILSGSLRRSLTLGTHPRPSDREIEAMARQFGLDPVLQRLGGLDGAVAEAGRNLSSGEIWRVLTVRALLSGHDVLLFDSPDRALDPAAASRLVKTIQDMAATVVVTTDDPALARQFSRVLTLADGRLRPAAG